MDKKGASSAGRVAVVAGLTVPRRAATAARRLTLGLSWAALAAYLWSAGDVLLVGPAAGVPPALRWAALAAVLLATAANWLLESAKWRVAMRPFCAMTLSRAVRGVVYGFPFAAVFPNRMGGYLGRMWVVPPRARLRGAVATALGNAAQLFSTLFFGVVALALWARGRGFPFVFRGALALWAAVLSAAFVALAAVWVFRGGGRWPRRLRRAARGLARAWRGRDLAAVAGLAAARYWVFVLQMWLLAVAFGLDIAPLAVFAGLGSMYLALALMPVLALVEPAARGALSALFLSPCPAADASVVAASVALWVANVGLPALVGGVALNLPGRRPAPEPGGNPPR